MTNEEKIMRTIVACDQIATLCVQPFVPGMARERLAEISGIVAGLKVEMEMPVTPGVSDAPAAE